MPPRACSRTCRRPSVPPRAWSFACSLYVALVGGPLCLLVLVLAKMAHNLQHLAAARGLLLLAAGCHFAA